MEEEKKEEVLTNETPVESLDDPAPTEVKEETPVETPAETTPVEEPKEEPKVEALEEPVVESLDEPAVESLDDPAPVESLDEPATTESLDSEPKEEVKEEVKIESVQDTPAPKETIDEAPPIVHKVEDSPIADAEVKKEEVKPEPPKEEPKKEEPKKDEQKDKKQKSKLPIILGVGAVLIILVVVFRLTLGGGFGSKNEPEEKKDDTIIGGKQEIKTYSTDNATKLIESLLVFDKIDNKAGAIEMFCKNTTVNAPDLSNDQVFLMVYNKYFKDKREVKLEDLKNKIKDMFAEYAYTPANFTPECQTFHMNYDEAGAKFTRVDFDGMCGFTPGEKYAPDAYKVTDTNVDGTTLVVTVQVYFGRGEDETKESTHYFDYERNTPVEDGVVVMKDGKVDTTATDFSRGTKYQFTFKEIDKNIYAFVKAEMA